MANPIVIQGFNLGNLSKLVDDGKLFSIEFIRRTDGKLRKMTCRLGVTKALKGGKQAYDPAKHNLLNVYDIEKSGYRSIPVENVQRLSVHGQTFQFV